MKYYRVKTGYGADDFISITQDELPMAVRAQITGRVGIFKEGTITGSHIISITPDFQRIMGWSRDYQLKGEDYDEIGMETINGHRQLLEKTNDEVRLQLEGGSLRLSA